MNEINLYNLPEGWIWKTLGELCNTTSGGTPLRGETKYYGGRIPWLKSGELKNNYIFNCEESITNEGLDNSSAKLFPKGTLLMALYGATAGKLGILGIEAATNQAICAIFIHPELFKKFLFWYLFHYRKNLLAIRFGGAQPNLSQTIIKRIPIPLPPLLNQNQIVEKIEELFTKLDYGVNLLETIKAKLKQYRQSVLKSAFDGKLTKEWRINHYLNEWNLIALGDIIQPSKERVDPNDISKTNYIGLEHIQQATGKIIGFGSSDDVRSTKSKFYKGDLLYGKLRPYLNKVYLAEFDGICSTDILVFPKKDTILSEFLLYRFLSNDFVNYASQNVSGIQLPRVNIKTISKFKIRLPSLNEQVKIIEEIKRHYSVLDKLKIYLKKNLLLSDKLKQSILSNAFAGKLVNLSEDSKKYSKNALESNYEKNPRNNKIKKDWEKLEKNKQSKLSDFFE